MAARGLVSHADVRMILSLILTLVGAYLIVTGQPLPQAFIGIWGTAMGFYFASRENGAERDHVEAMSQVKRF